MRTIWGKVITEKNRESHHVLSDGFHDFITLSTMQP
jgi:hypothetical protein